LVNPSSFVSTIRQLTDSAGARRAKSKEQRAEGKEQRAKSKAAGLLLRCCCRSGLWFVVYLVTGYRLQVTGCKSSRVIRLSDNLVIRFPFSVLKLMNSYQYLVAFSSWLVARGLCSHTAGFRFAPQCWVSQNRCLLNSFLFHFYFDTFEKSTCFYPESLKGTDGFFFFHPPGAG
jgi:hypothetical protein